MFGQATIPDPRTALDQTPAAPNPLQRLRLAEALYYASKDYRDSESSFPATFDQLYHEHSGRYFALGDYLLERRSRSTARPVPVSAFEERLFAHLDGVLSDAPGHLLEQGQRTPSERLAAEWLLDYYALSAERATELAGRWVVQVRAKLPGGVVPEYPY